MQKKHIASDSSTSFKIVYNVNVNNIYIYIYINIYIV